MVLPCAQLQYLLFSVLVRMEKFRIKKKKITTNIPSPDSVALARTTAHQRLSSFQDFHHGNKWTLPEFLSRDEASSFYVNVRSAFRDCWAKPLYAHCLAVALTSYCLSNSFDEMQWDSFCQTWDYCKSLRLTFWNLYGFNTTQQHKNSGLLFLKRREKETN